MSFLTWKDYWRERRGASLRWAVLRWSELDMAEWLQTGDMLTFPTIPQVSPGILYRVVEPYARDIRARDVHANKDRILSLGPLWDEWKLGAMILIRPHEVKKPW